MKVTKIDQNNKERIERLEKLLRAINLLLECEDKTTALLVARQLLSACDDHMDSLLTEIPLQNPQTVPAIDKVTQNALFENSIDTFEDYLLSRMKYFFSNPQELLSLVAGHKKGLLVIASMVAFLLLANVLWAALYKNRHGLMTEYHLMRDLNHLHTVKRADEINFRWRERGPLRNFPTEHFSVRWTGFLKVGEEGDYDFYTLSDDGVRLWIGDNLVINNWTDHSETLDHGRLKLSRGHHKLKLDYYQGVRDATIKLYWKRSGQKNKKIIRSKFFVPDEKYL